MYSETPNRMLCPDFESRLSEALDNTLSIADRVRFDAHRAECPNCALMFAEAAAGMRWLDALQEVELPANFVHNVLAATSGHAPAAAAAAPRAGWWERLRGAVPRATALVVQPRFAMSCAMAFFSVTMLLNIAGLKLTDLRHVDLRPSALVRGYYETTGRLVKYYENIRFVYEIESRVQELKRATTPESAAPAEQNDKQQKDRNRNDHSGAPDHKYQNYSREEGRPVLASWREPQRTPRRKTAAGGSYGLPHGPASEHRRLS
ncbi:MAG TPA: zf-HC2 domain-containing protein [Terriglobales bacterium]|nr:zf-HC2 domain-containing protein [Terriglobales bacterium]